MSRSKREAIYKDHHPKMKSNYHRVVRRVTNQTVRECLYDPNKDEEIPQPQEVVNDYDYCDWVFNIRDWGDESEIKRAARK